MTNLTSLMANLSELKMDVLSTNQMSNLKGGCGSSYGGGKSHKNKSGRNKSGRNKSGHGGGYGGGYGGGCGCGCGCGGSTPFIG